MRIVEESGRRLGTVLAVLGVVGCSSAESSQPQLPDFDAGSDASSHPIDAGIDASGDAPVDQACDVVEDADGSGESSLPMAAPPVFSPSEGTYAYGTQIVLSSPEPDATIHLTLNTEPPTVDSPQYDGPITLTGAASPLNVQAISVCPGKEPSAVAVGQYFLEPSLIIHFKKPSSWSQPMVHYWDTVPDGLSTTWPGVALEPEGDGWYSLALPHQTSAWMVFSDNGSPQTEDLHLAWEEGWYVDGDFWDIDPRRFERFAFPGGRYKALVMSYDDGNVQDEQLIGLFEQYGIRGTFHLNSGLMSQVDKIPASEVAAVYAGHEVSAHSATHPYLDSLDAAALEQEIRGDQQALEALVGYPVRGLSYPFGSYSDTLLSLLPGWGFSYGRVVPSTGDFRLPNDLLLWRGSCHHTDALGLGNALVAHNASDLALLFVWGHSWELDEGVANNSWSHMEAFCQTVGNRSDTWYATAAEVADYVLAMRSAEFSLLGDWVRNSSGQSLWVEKDGQPVEVLAGETLAL